MFGRNTNRVILFLILSHSLAFCLGSSISFQYSRIEFIPWVLFCVSNGSRELDRGSRTVNHQPVVLTSYTAMAQQTNDRSCFIHQQRHRRSCKLEFYSFTSWIIVHALVNYRFGKRDKSCTISTHFVLRSCAKKWFIVSQLSKVVKGTFWFFIILCCVLGILLNFFFYSYISKREKTNVTETFDILSNQMCTK